MEQTGSYDALSRARRAWGRCDPETALRCLRDIDPNQEPIGEARELAASIELAIRAAERSTAHFFHATSFADPRRLPTYQRASELRLITTSVLSTVDTTLAPAPPSAAAIARNLEELLPAKPNNLGALYGRDWALIEMGRNGADLWWLGRPVLVPRNRHPLVCLVPLCGRKLYRSLRRLCHLLLSRAVRERAAGRLRTLLAVGLSAARSLLAQSRG